MCMCICAGALEVRDNGGLFSWWYRQFEVARHAFWKQNLGLLKREAKI